MKNLFPLKRILILSLLFFVIYSNAQFSFYTELRNARWESSVIDNNSNAVTGSTTRLYPDILGGSNGEVSMKETIMEDGLNYKVIYTHPKWKKNGTIKGWFPVINNLPKKSTLSGMVGFVKPSSGKLSTDGVRFLIFLHYYENGREKWKPIVDIKKSYTGKLEEFSYDLSAYAGKKVYFELRVDAGNSPGQDWAAWVYPQITRHYNYNDVVNGNKYNTPRFQPLPKPIPDSPNNTPKHLLDKTYFLESNLGDGKLFMEVKENYLNKDSRLNSEVFTGALEEQFYFENAGGGFFYIKPKSNLRTKRYLTIVPTANKDIMTVETKPFTGETTQKWMLKRAGGNYFYIISKHGFYLDIKSNESKAKKYIWAVNSNYRRNAKWKLNDINKPFVFKREFNIRRIENLCPTTLVSGDREFGGNGPRIYGEIDVVVNRTSLDAIIKFNARETKSDWSHVRGEWVKNIVNLPRGWRINRIVYPNRKSFFDYTTSGMPRHGFQFNDSGSGRGTLSMTRDGFAKNLRVVGDTGGKDISDDNNCHDDTKITFIDFKPITLEITYSRN